VPMFVFYPVMIVLFGIGERPIVAIAVVFAIAAMILSTITALDRIPPALFKTARIHRLTLPQRVAFLLLPAALPHLMVGLRLVTAYALIATIAGEFILSSVGIGHEIAFSYDNFMTARMYGLILIVIVAAVGLNAALARLVRRWGGEVGRDRPMIRGVSDG
jgi:NitT/TauT family transport system permease protein